MNNEINNNQNNDFALPVSDNDQTNFLVPPSFQNNEIETVDLSSVNSNNIQQTTTPQTPVNMNYNNQNMNQQMVNMNYNNQNMNQQPISNGINDQVNPNIMKQEEKPVVNKSIIDGLLNEKVKEKKSDEDFLLDYVGTNYIKLNNSMFNFAAFFFGPLYMFYRKCLLLGIIEVVTVILVEFIATLIFKFQSTTPLMVISLIIMAVFALVFNRYYINRCREKIAKLRKQNPNADQFTFASLCYKKGRTSIGYVILGSILLSIIMAVLGLILSLLMTLSLFKNLNLQFGVPGMSGFSFSITDGEIDNDSSITIDGTASTDTSNGYQGALTSSSNYPMTKYLTVTAPDGFVLENEKDYRYTLNYDLNGEDCVVSIFSPEGFSDAKKLGDEMVKFHSKQGMKMSTLSQNKIGSNTWYHTEYNLLGHGHYYITDKNNRVYIVQFFYRDVKTNKTCPNSITPILKSIKIQ